MDFLARLHIVNRVLEAMPLLAFATAWVRRGHIPYAFRPVYYYVGAEAFLWFLDRLSRITIRNNVYIYHLATVLMVFFLAQAYRRLLPFSRIQKAITPSLVVFALVAFLDAAWLNGLFHDVNSYSQALGSAILLTLAMLHVAQLTLQSPIISLGKQPGFFLSVALLLYCSCSIITYTASNLIYNNPDYDKETRIQLDILISFPDTLLLAIAMALLAWMFAFFPLSTNPRRALPQWLHYSSWRPMRLRQLPLPTTEQRPSRRQPLPLADVHPSL